jgi:hypothetical protein
VTNLPLASVGADTSRPQTSNGRGLDGWILNQLFGRR